MPSTLFFPLDRIQPSQILSQYSEWIYFIIIFIFFISISGITLRRHFEKPYVKPLILAVGLMMTIGVFRFKGLLVSLFEGWGIVGSLLLVFVSATIPYGLCRGFGLNTGKAFYLTYILFYILSWVQFPEFYYALADKNLGLVNLGLLIIFVLAIFKLIKFRKSPSSESYRGKGVESRRPEIDHEIEEEVNEKDTLKSKIGPLTKIEIRTLEDMSEALAEIQRTVESHGNSISQEDRLKIARMLENMSKKESVFQKVTEKIRSLLKQIEIRDVNQLKELEQRIATAEGKEKRILQVEMAGEQEKLKMEKTINRFESRLNQGLVSLNEHLRLANQLLRNSPYPNDAKPSLSHAREVLKDIFEISKETEILEKKLAKLINREKSWMRKEKKSV